MIPGFLKGAPATQPPGATETAPEPEFLDQIADRQAIDFWSDHPPPPPLCMRPALFVPKPLPQETSSPEAPPTYLFHEILQALVKGLGFRV